MMKYENFGKASDAKPLQGIYGYTTAQLKKAYIEYMEHHKHMEAIWKSTTDYPETISTHRRDAVSNTLAIMKELEDLWE